MSYSSQFAWPFNDLLFYLRLSGTKNVFYVSVIPIGTESINSYSIMILGRQQKNVQI